MDCKRALEEAQDDFDRAKTIIFEKGLAKAEKRSDRSTGAGLLETYVHNGRVSVMLELRCETDFVARTDVFKELAHNLVMHIAAMNPENLEELLKQEYVKNPSMSIDDLVKEAIGKTGENMKIEKFCRFEL